MILPRPARYLLLALLAVGFFVLIEFHSSLSSTVIGLIIVGMLAIVIGLFYFVGREMSPLHNVTAVLLLGFFILFLQLNRIQVLQASEVQAVPGNNRQTERVFGDERGEILSSDGVVVAFSEPATESETFDFRRVYPHGELYAHTVGYVSLTFGSEGIEQSYQDALVADTGELGLVSGGEPTDLVLGINHELQLAAREALKDPETGADRNGSVVALDPRTGEIRALWSYPSFDPQPLASLSSREALDAVAEIEPSTDLGGIQCLDTPRCPKAYGDRQSPGSTFKVVVGGAALDSTPIELDSPVFPSVEAFNLPDGGATISNYNNANCGGPLLVLIARSCNAGFAQIAIEDVGPDQLIAQAERFGFNTKIPLDVPESDVVASNFPTDFGEFRGDGRGFDLFDKSNDLGQTAIGQFEVQATPLNMALVAAGIANEGTIMVPRIVAGEAVDDTTLDPFEPQEWRDATTRASANDLRDAMFEVVRNGTGTNLQIEGLDVGAKTGTADVGDDVHAWVISFAGPVNADPELAVAVLVERQQGEAGITGGRVAAPIARELFENFYGLDS